ncbi:MAG: hypothetical protein IT445_19720 [Phycisphaeraceae bacterium]|nr:hypothetical protein [Phycisphaeraceae bacterium]
MWTRCLLLTGLMLTAPACKPQESPAPPPQTPPEPQVETDAAAAAKQDVTLGDVTGTAEAYARQEADQLAAASRQKLEQMQAQFDQLKAAAAEKGEQAEAKLAEMKQTFDARIEEAQKELDQFKDANAEHVEQIQKDLSSAMSEAGAVLENAWEAIKGEQQPEAAQP